ncbi:MAG: AbrB/MazE/SpoVT family DNA-binding domain-containing protein [Myxococcota bacterium]|nr:AbrB/MazE/SpoVT family DNA-binding domain-containing protein [Myxococcota bacterium]
MKAQIIQIGNSRGIRIPRPLFEQTGIESEVRLVVEGNKIIIMPAIGPRDGWEAAFRTMAENEDDLLLDTAALSSWDDEEWEW